MNRLFLPLLFAAALAAPAADLWKIAPPPPASWQRDRVADLNGRRKAVMERVGEKGILILYAAEPRNYAGDVDWPFRQENQFFYLTAIDQPGSTLVLIPGADSVREILFMPPSNPAQESWTGHILTPPEARQISGIQEIWDARQLPAFLGTLIPQAKEMLEAAAAAEKGHGGRGPASPPPPIPVNVAATFPKTIEDSSKGEAQVYMISGGRPAEYQREIEFAQKLGTLTPPLKVTNATSIFSKLRSVKSPRELDLLQHAVNITAEAFQRAYTAAVAGTPEYEIQAQFEFTFLRRNAHWGYPCIVASGVNATTLHYETNKDQMKAGDLLLMDDAAEFDGYSVDATRTIPVSGKFNKEQADIYRLVWEAQQAAFKHALPGHTMSGNPASVQSAALAVFKQGLFKLGLIADADSDQQARIWFNHGVGHGIGLNVHDPLTGELQPGMVVTVEPGLYFRPDALDNLPKTPENEKFIAAVRPAFEKYKGIGVRIEDDVMITNGQPKVISSAIPSKLEEVELSIAQLRRAIEIESAAVTEMHKPSFDPGLTRQFTSPVTRIINKDGSFNVRRTGVTWRDFHPYLHLINMSWSQFLFTVFLAYVVVNTLFAMGYFFIAPGQLQGADAPSPMGRFLNDFFFSAHTLTTVGYGSISPKGLVGNILAALEALTGVMAFAVAAG